MLINRSIYNQFKKSCCTSCHKYFITTFTQSLQQQPQKMCISADMKISEYFIPYWYQVLVRLYFKFLFFFFMCVLIQSSYQINTMMKPMMISSFKCTDRLINHLLMTVSQYGSTRLDSCPGALFKFTNFGPSSTFNRTNREHPSITKISAHPNIE